MFAFNLRGVDFAARMSRRRQVSVIDPGGIGVTMRQSNRLEQLVPLALHRPRQREHIYCLSPGVEQGLGTFPDGCTGGIHVIDEQHVPLLNPFGNGDGKGIFDIVPAFTPFQLGLRYGWPRPFQEEWINTYLMSMANGA